MSRTSSASSAERTNEVRAQVQGEAEVLLVLLRQRGHADVDARQREPLVVGDLSALDDEAHDVGTLDRDDGEREDLGGGEGDAGEGDPDVDLDVLDPAADDVPGVRGALALLVVDRPLDAREDG